MQEFLDALPRWLQLLLIIVSIVVVGEVVSRIVARWFDHARSTLPPTSAADETTEEHLDDDKS